MRTRPQLHRNATHLCATLSLAAIHAANMSDFQSRAQLSHACIRPEALAP